MVDNTISNDTIAMMEFEANKKSVGVAYLFWLFLGFVGGHRFYLKRKGSAIVMLIISLFALMTESGIGVIILIWWLIDAFLITGIVSEYNNGLINSIKEEGTKT